MNSRTIARFSIPRRLSPGAAVALSLAAAGLCAPARAETTAAQRLTCLLGEEPDRVAKARQGGRSAPDAADTCIAALAQSARDGRLPDLYRALLTQLGGDVELASKLPLAIGAAALDGKPNVAIGGGKQMDVAPSIAFDAGFTVAYLKGDDRSAGLDASHLKRVAEACLAVNKDAGTCFSAGYTYGQQTVRGGVAASR